MQSRSRVDARQSRTWHTTQHRHGANTEAQSFVVCGCVYHSVIVHGTAHHSCCLRSAGNPKSVRPLCGTLRSNYCAASYHHDCTVSHHAWTCAVLFSVSLYDLLRKKQRGPVFCPALCCVSSVWVCARPHARTDRREGEHSGAVQCSSAAAAGPFKVEPFIIQSEHQWIFYSLLNI